jgi:GNAT superfamily N-acetyltransferase
MIITVDRGEYSISTDAARLQPLAIHAFLSQAYWSVGLPMAVLERALAHSLCFGLFHGNAQVGLARVVSDRATFAYLADVYVLPEHRGQGLSKWLVHTVLAHPELQGLRRFLLATRDAHGLYAQHGFQPLRSPDRMMEVLDLEVYKTQVG